MLNGVFLYDKKKTRETEKRGKIVEHFFFFSLERFVVLEIVGFDHPEKRTPARDFFSREVRIRLAITWGFLTGEE